MPRIIKVRPVLLSAPYADPEFNLEVLLHLPSGLRTTGLVEITLDDGVSGLGEGYLAVFAPEVFRTMVELVAPYLIGRDPRQLTELVRDAAIITGYWSFQGAARHVVSAIEIALQDCCGKLLGLPVWRMLGGTSPKLKLYASGGDSRCPEAMQGEIAQVAALGIRVFKIRARNHQVDKALWCQRAAAARGIEIAVDMTQNLAIPSQTPEAAAAFVTELRERSGSAPAFLEEALGPDRIGELPELRRAGVCPIAGGEIVTTPDELNARIAQGCYDIAQPDASVIGGIGAVLAVSAFARGRDTAVYVHSWGGAVSLLANYHAAAAAGEETAEWPLPQYPLRQRLMAEPWGLRDGGLQLAEVPGIGAVLTPELEREFPFRPEAVYRCLPDVSRVPAADWS